MEAEQPDLVVLDLHMPGMDGIDTLGQMMALNPKLPVVIYSVYERLKDNFMTWTADVYLVKSSDIEILKGEIERVLSERKAQGRWPIWPQDG